MSPSRPSLEPPLVDVRRGFDSFESDEVEVLDIFLGDAAIVSESRFANHLKRLGERPKLTIDRQFPGGGGEGRIHVTAASRGVRHEAFPVLRKLRTESNYASLAAVRNLLHKHSRNRDNKDAREIVGWLKELKVLIRKASHGEALIAFRVTDEGTAREYNTTGEVLNLVQNGSVFHNEPRPLRDLRALPEPLVDPVVDDGLRQVAELTLALASLVLRVASEPALRRR